MSPEEAIQELIYHGLSEENADIVVQNIYNEIRHAKKQRANKDMLHGFLWLAGGSIITALTYMGAKDGGGVYFVFWGAIIFGGYQFLRGLFSSH